MTEPNNKPITDEEFKEFCNWLLSIDDTMANKVKEFIYRLENFGRDCYCCSCSYTDYGSMIWDAACRNHGAHGERGCVRHKQSPKNCECGCDFKIIEGE